MAARARDALALDPDDVSSAAAIGPGCAATGEATGFSVGAKVSVYRSSAEPFSDTVRSRVERGIERNFYANADENGDDDRWELDEEEEIAPESSHPCPGTVVVVRNEATGMRQTKYTLLNSRNQPYGSDSPGMLGGNSALRIYGRLDCYSAIAALPKGYAKHRVFFASEEDAILAGYRPCGNCLKDRYRVWSEGGWLALLAAQPRLDQELYKRALDFAARSHGDQKVPGTGFPYMVHVVKVAMEVMAAHPLDLGLAVACALLHDTVEDSPRPRSETEGLIEKEFGPKVLKGVLALTKDDSLPKQERMAASLQAIQTQPREVWMVKLADRITNLEPPPPHWTPEKRRAYLQEAKVILDALGEASPLLQARLALKCVEYERYCQ